MMTGKRPRTLLKRKISSEKYHTQFRYDCDNGGML
jgi:hypothetical protein